MAKYVVFNMKGRKKEGVFASTMTKSDVKQWNRKYPQHHIYVKKTINKIPVGAKREKKTLWKMPNKKTQKRTSYSWGMPQMNFGW